MFGQDRASLRTVFFEAWRKHLDGTGLEPLEQQIVAVLTEHPEYQGAVSDPEAHMERDYEAESGESNPFLHLSLHLALRDQIATDRPPGMRQAFAALSLATGRPHEAEHLAIAQLQEILWDAQRNGSEPDERAYLAGLQRLANERVGSV